MPIRPLSTELQEKAVKELNEEPGKQHDALENIREWLKKQPHLNVREDDQTMVAFFRGCKWNLQRVKEKLDYFYSIKSFVPEFFDDRNPFSPAVQDALKAGAVVPVPKVDSYLGPRIVLFIMKNGRMNGISFADMLKVFFMTVDILMQEDDNFVISGICLLVDHSDLPLDYFLQYTPSILRKYVMCVQDAYPLRIDRIFGFSSPTVFATLYNALAKPFISSKLQPRVSVLSGDASETLPSILSKELLPIEYGGTNGTVRDAADEWKTKVESYKEWFLADPNYITNEQLRPQKLTHFEEIFCPDGTFKKLDID
ncbi:clavesin-1-like [Photinus pyralis]|uniref:clavesin-1-like n=1 Tax=Photinus pyralis TaxID=7054 RepID=UPI001267293E|nr:clavesin-1-like [Photinus pyralis]XP_031345642.1 clavesin-1-like [Photinus pyralis]